MSRNRVGYATIIVGVFYILAGGFCILYGGPYVVERNLLSQTFSLEPYEGGFLEYGQYEAFELMLGDDWTFWITFSSNGSETCFYIMDYSNYYEWENAGHSFENISAWKEVLYVNIADCEYHAPQNASSSSWYFVYANFGHDSITISTSVDYQQTIFPFQPFCLLFCFIGIPTTIFGIWYVSRKE